MILRLPDGSVYVAHFSYSVTDGQRKTHCRLHAGPCSMTPCPIWTWIGHARCSVEDHFVKSVGRKLALARALHNWTFAQGSRNRGEIRAFRRAIWLAYFAATAAPPPKEPAG